jgi:hypothetical protein
MTCTQWRNRRSWQIWIGSTILTGLFLVTVSCGKKNAPPKIIGFSPPSPLVVVRDSTPIQVNVATNDHVIQNYRWSVKKGEGEILSNGKCLMTYQAPATPGWYEISVELEYSGNRPVKDSVIVQVVGVATPTPTNTPAATPTPTTTPTPTPTPTPTLRPPPILDEPENDSVFDSGSEVVLRWSCPFVPQTNECFQLNVTPKVQDSPLCLQENRFSLTTLSPGEYNWAVVAVHSTPPHKPVSKESASRSFQIALPSPVVYSVSPTITLQGTSVPIVISGENFTNSLTLTIGVPLQVTFVNSRVITTTIPTSLTVGQYSVIVRDSHGKGASLASLIVKEPPTSQPVTPVPVFPYPAPTLLEPPNGARFDGAVPLRWEWDERFQLEEDEYFAVRAYLRGTDHESRTWTKDKETTVILYGEPEGDYCWHICVLRGEPDDWTQLSPNSEERCFYAVWPLEPPTPMPIPSPDPNKTPPPRPSSKGLDN